MFNVCYGCEERHIGCHGYCERYIEAKIKFEKEKEHIKKQRDIERVQSEFKREMIHKTMRNK